MSKLKTIEEILDNLLEPFVDNDELESPDLSPYNHKYQTQLNQALADLSTIVRDIIGVRVDNEKFKDMSKYAQRKVLIEYELRVKQLKTAKDYGLDIK